MHLQNAIYTKKVMSDHNLSFTFSSPGVENISVGNTITYKGQQLIIRKEPQVQKLSTNRYNYNVIFEGALYQLNDMPFMHNGDITFSYFGNAEQYALLLAECMRVINPLWKISNIAQTDEQHISFDNVTCLEAITQIAQAFKIEWDINGFEINMPTVVGKQTNLVFEYGKGKGLYNITRSPVQNEGIFTRVLAYGSTKNLPIEYNGTRLKLNEPIDNNIDKYGLKVTTFINDNIYPHRDGTVSTINTDGVTFTDNGIDFDINSYLLEGAIATVVFKSGELTGYEFELVRFTNATKQFRIKKKVESDDYTLPNDTFKINVGDKYTIVNIRMPDSYIASAKAELLASAQKYLSEVSIPQVTYTCDIDVLHMKREGITLNAGDYVTIKDADLGIDKKIRIQSVSYPALYPDVLTTGMTFTIEIGDYITYSTLTSIKKEIKEQNTNLGNVSKDAQEINRNAVINLKEFRAMVFDPDGNIAEPFIQAVALEVGAESQYFDLNGVFINTMLEGNPNAIEITSGELIHYAYSITTGSTWLISGLTKTDLLTNTPYYISAKCSTTSLIGTWYISNVPMGVNSEAGFYHFNLGTLSSVINGQRFANITKGFTKIVGGQIDTDTLTVKRVALPQMEMGLHGSNEQAFYYDLEKTKKAVSFGVINGKPQMIWYGENGEEIWNASKNGIVYVTNVPESFTPTKMLICQNINTANTPIDIDTITANLSVNVKKNDQGNLELITPVERYLYDAGTNVDTEANSIYTGYHVSSSKTSDFITHGFYVFDTPIYPNIDKPFYYTASIYKIWQGKIIGNPIYIDLFFPS